ncbi:MAG: hypothetical protein J6U68_00270 [Clostridia bacterium]|nr:hypothetical protein [Clostridia bacterium]
MKLKNLFKRSVAAALLLCFLLTILTSCKKEEPVETVKISEMSNEELAESVVLCDYKELEIPLGEKSKQEAIVSYIDMHSAVKSYPAGTVDYYIGQLKTQYEYYAKEAGVSYEAMLDELGEDNFTMQAEAKRLVKSDLIFELIRRNEDITLSDEEKSEFFDKYVKKYAESYGYSEEHVREELSELVYESMLYDKTVEFLILNNTFIESE